MQSVARIMFLFCFVSMFDIDSSSSVVRTNAMLRNDSVTAQRFAMQVKPFPLASGIKRMFAYVQLFQRLIFHLFIFSQ
jgi:hypothetical protein